MSRARRAVAARVLPLLGALALGAVLASSAQAAPAMPAVPDTTVLAQRGFGNVHNSYAWGMAWFRGNLYVGTGRYVSCVEAATTDFYFPVAGAYKTYFPPSQHCPRNRWDMDLRAEIWRYAPSTGRWTRVYRSPTVPNPSAPGKRIARDIAYRGMSVRNDPDGRPALFISGVSPDEIVPKLARTSPPRLLRTYDGTSFRDIAQTFVVHKTGAFSDLRVIGFRGMTWWRGRLYVLASTAYAGDGSVFEVLDPWKREGPSRFRQVTPTWMPVFEMETFDGQLYVGAGDRSKGYSVWKTRHPERPHDFKAVVTDGAGRGPLMTGVIAMHKFKGQLYVTAVSWYATPDLLPTTEMIRIAPDDSWQVTVGRPRVGPDGVYRYPLSGLMDGFDNAFVPHIWRMQEQDGALYAGTLDWSYLLQNSKDWPTDDRPYNDQFAGLLTQVLAGELGFDLWSTCDGIDWFPVTKTAFGVDMYDFGVRTMVPGPKGNLYIGTADHGHGARIFDHQADDCVALPDRPLAVTSRAAARPQQLLADVQNGGTVLSWERGAQAAQYDVLRASGVTIPLSMRAPLAMPNGWFGDGQVPELAPVGSEGSTEVEVPLPGRFEELGTTTGSSFVDRTAQPGERYTYQVVARGAGGATAASNFQAVPDPRPAATFEALRKHLPIAGAASVRDDAWPTDARSRQAEIARLERLSRTAPDDQARDIARRLARRLQYAGLAGAGG